jgi:hypothetical protein
MQYYATAVAGKQRSRRRWQWCTSHKSPSRDAGYTRANTLVLTSSVSRAPLPKPAWVLAMWSSIVVRSMTENHIH